MGNSDYEMLKGVRVVELTNYIAGPSAGRVLGDWGAEVIKIETAPDGDTVRWGVVLPGMISKPEMSVTFEVANANKKSVVLNLRTPEGKEAMDKLLATADVFLSNFRGEALKAMGLDYDTLHSQYPKLVWAQIQGYGDVGPLSKAPGFDTTAYWSMSGGLTDFAERDTSPVVAPTGFGDLGAGACLAGAICAALYGCSKTGEGRRLVLSLFGMAVWQMGVILSAHPEGLDIYPKTRKEKQPLNNAYKTKDGNWVQLSLFQYEAQFPVLMKLIGREDLINDERYNTFAAADANNKELIAMMDEAIEKFTKDEMEKMLTEKDLPHGWFGTIDGLLNPNELNGQQAMANEFLKEMTHRNGMSRYEVTSPVQVNGPHAAPRKNAPLLGEDTSYYLKEVGYSDEQIEDMLAKGIAVEHHDTNYKLTKK